MIGTLAQCQVNLVPNPSFEIIDSCPSTPDQISFAAPWFGGNPDTPDLYNECSSSFTSSVPQNWMGTQAPKTGNGYAAVGSYGYTYNGTDNRRQYLEVQLLQPLVVGRIYCVEFYASLSDSSYWAISRLGLHISNLPVVDLIAIDTLSVIPQISFDSNAVFTDTMNWVRINGVYLANGYESYITIGNFYADDQTDTIAFPFNNDMLAYFYIDDVAVYELAECNAGSDISICYMDSIQLGTAPRTNVLYEWLPADGLSNPNISNPIASPDTTIQYILKQTECDAVIYDTVNVTVNRDCHSAASIFIPTAVIATNEFFISGLESNSQLDIYDVRGRLVYASDDYQNDFRFMTEGQALYVAVLTRPNGEQICKKVCVIKGE